MIISEYTEILNERVLQLNLNNKRYRKREQWIEKVNKGQRSRE